MATPRLRCGILPHLDEEEFMVRSARTERRRRDAERDRERRLPSENLAVERRRSLDVLHVEHQVPELLDLHGPPPPLLSVAAVFAFCAASVATGISVTCACDHDVPYTDQPGMAGFDSASAPSRSGGPGLHQSVPRPVSYTHLTL